MPTTPTQRIVRLPDRDAFVDSALSLLRRYDLTPDRVDRERGLIVTERTTSAQGFEFWRIDSQGPYQVLESSLQTIGHVVTLTLEPESAAQTRPAAALAAPAPPVALAASETAESPATTASAPAERYRLTVRVDKSRYDGPERQITTASGAFGLYNENVPTMAGERGPKTKQVDWVPLGRDGLLEQRLLSMLLESTPGIEVVE